MLLDLRARDMNRRGVAVGVALLPLIIITAVKWPSGPPFAMGDPYHFLLHARALLEGNAYADTGYLFTGWNIWHGPRVQPPGMPLTLVPALALFGGGDVAVQLFMLMFTLAFLGVAGWFLAGQQGVWIGGGVAMLTGFATGFHDRITFVQSDLPFALLFWVLILLVDGVDRPGNRRLAAVTVLCAVALTYRVVAVAFIPALAVYALLAWERRKRWMIPVAVFGVLGILAQFVRPGMLAAFGPSLLNPLDLIQHVPDRVAGHMHSLLAAMLYPFPWNVANDAYHLVAGLFLIVGLVSWMKSNPRQFSLWLAITYVSMILILPVVARQRYMWPVFPLVPYCILRGVSVVVARFRPERRQVAVAAVVAVLLVGTVVSTLMRPTRPAVTDHPAMAGIIQHLNQRTDSLRISSIVPRVLTWYTRVPGMPIPLSLDYQDVVRELETRDISHVLVTNIDPEDPVEQLLRDVIEEYPDRFTSEFVSGDLVMYRFARTRPPPSPGLEP